MFLITFSGFAKRTIESEPTQQFPCREFEMNTCYEVYRNTKIAEEFNCRLSFLQGSNHLQKFIPGFSELPFCNPEIIGKVLNMSCTECDEQCNNTKACSSTLYRVKQTPIEISWIPDDLLRNNTTLLAFEFSSFQVEHYISYISYDFLSLVAELGGLMGMTLGIAFSSIGDLMANLTKKLLAL